MPQVAVTGNFAVTIPDAPAGKPQGLTIRNLDSANTVYVAPRRDVGASGTAGGMPIMPGEIVDFVDPPELFIIAASGQTALVAWENI